MRGALLSDGLPTTIGVPCVITLDCPFPGLVTVKVRVKLPTGKSGNVTLQSPFASTVTFRMKTLPSAPDSLTWTVWPGVPVPEIVTEPSGDCVTDHESFKASAAF